MTLSLRISAVELNVIKTMQFEPSTIVYDACRMIRERIPEENPGNRKILFLYVHFVLHAEQRALFTDARSVIFLLKRENTAELADLTLQD